jgi:hypothetical protein
LILDLTLLVGIGTFILDDLEELFNTHLDGGLRFSIIVGLMMSVKLKVREVTRLTALASRDRVEWKTGARSTKSFGKNNRFHS